MFEDASNDQAYAKFGFLGTQGSGKTHTAALVSIGLAKLLRDRGIPGGEAVYMIDSETGSKWIEPMFRKEGIPLKVSKTRAFADLVDGVAAVAEKRGILLIDSITHFWQEVARAYKEENRRRKLTFNDWANLKEMWAEFTDLFVNGECHIFMCGRQGYEYDFFEDDDGKMQLQKTAVKMKAEADTGYEPSLLVMMERHQDLSQSGKIERVYRTAFILKDRGQDIDGKLFENPTFADFLPHIEQLNLGGGHVGVDTTRNSRKRVIKDNDNRHENQQREIMLEEISGLVHKHHPSQSADDKQARSDLMFEFFATRSMKKVESLGLNELKLAYNKLHLKLEGKLLWPELDDSALLAVPGGGEAATPKDAGGIPF